MNESDALLKKNFADLKEWDAVLNKTDEFFAGVSEVTVFSVAYDTYDV